MYVMDDGYGTQGYVNYPQSISDVFPGLPSHIDAATIWTGNNKLYFFKGDKEGRGGERGRGTKNN